MEECTARRDERKSARRGVSLAARSGSGFGPVGSVAAQKVAVLDIPPVRPVYVRFHSLRAKPLRGGCLRRNNDGYVGICDRQLDHEDARRRCNDSRLDRRPAMLRLGTFKDFRDAEQQGFA